MVTLSAGVPKEIVSSPNPDNLPADPVFQVLGVKKIQSSGGQERYRLVLSDGEHYYTSVMLGTQLNDAVYDDGVDVKAVIRLDRYTCNVIQGARKIIIILELTVLTKASAIEGKIGQPVQLSDQVTDEPVTATVNLYMKEGPKPVSDIVPQSFQPKNIGTSSFPAKLAGQTLTGGGLLTNSVCKPNPTFGGSVSGGKNSVGTASASASASAPIAQKSVFPIASLTPYQNRWTIRARVTSKSAVRTWSNSKGEGKLFSVDLVDESGEIRATGFNDAVEKFCDLFETGKVYFITKGSLKIANKQYTALKNDYEISLNSDSIVELCTDDVDLPSIQYHFVNIADLENVNKDALVDVIGVVKSVGALSQITTKQTNREVLKRDITLVDRSSVAVTVTLWGGEAEKFESVADAFPVLAIKGAKVSDFGGRSLSILNSSVFQVNPDILEAYTLRGWYDIAGKTLEAKSISGQRLDGSMSGGEYKTVSMIKDEQLGAGEKADFFILRATALSFQKEKCLYKACPSDGCNKKLVEENGNYRCEKCDRTYPSFQYRLILSANVADFSGSQWLTAFQDSAEAILGVTAKDLGAMQERNEVEFERVFAESTFKMFTFKVRAKMETYKDETRLKCSALAAVPVDFKTETRRLSELIRKLESS